MQSIIAIIFITGLAMSTALGQENLFQGESSVPAPGKPFEVAINKSFEKNIRVKVFPHDLKNDWVHGVADDATQIALEGDLDLNGERANKASIKINRGYLQINLDNGKRFKGKNIKLFAETPIKLIRHRNPDKSHSYLGSLEISATDKGILVINQLAIEEYLRGVVPKESVHTWPLEVLKAQAVAARTYAAYHLLTSNSKDWDVDDTARFQVYAGASAAMDSTDLAIEQTSNEILTHNSKVIVAFFHAYSGGRTDSAKNIFGNAVAYCQGSEEIFSREELRSELKPSSQWIVEWTTDWMDKSKLLSKLKSNASSKPVFASFSSNKAYTIAEDELNENFQSVKTLRFLQDQKEASLNFINIRKALGWSNFPAYHFRLLNSDEGKVAFRGHGWGHHVGLSQWGAYIMAKNYGKTYAEILFHYYTGVELSWL